MKTGPILGPGMVKIGLLAKNIPISQVFIIFRPIFLKIMIFEKLIFRKVDYFCTFNWYFEAWEHQNRTRHEKILPGSYSKIFWPDGKLIGARRRSKIGKR